MSALIAAACLLIAVAAIGLYRQGLEPQVAFATTSVGEICNEISVLNSKSGAGSKSELRLDIINVVLRLALEHRPGVEGGAWSKGKGFVAYAYPTYETGDKLDTPLAEQPRIAALTAQAVDTNQPRTDIRRGQREVNILTACPLTASDAAWVMTRIGATGARANDNWAAILGALAGIIFLVGGWQVSRLLGWSRSLRGVAEAIGAFEDSDVKRLELTGHADLDQVCKSFNRSREELQHSIERERTLMDELRRGERSALIGGMVGSLAHEIRNPLGAMRLKVENALAGSPDRAASALQTVLTQTDRLEALLNRLLALGRPLTPSFQDVDIPHWLKNLIAMRSDQAVDLGISLSERAEATSWRFDPEMIGEAVDNLVQNALQHTPRGGEIEIAVFEVDKSLKFVVADNGPGINPDLIPRLFTPFTTGRSGGTGLGLSIARDIAVAHGGCLDVKPGVRGATFELSLPWPRS